MIGKISGRLDWKGLDTVLIDCRGVGYILHVSDRTMAAMPPVGEAVALYTELLVREDLLQLFGFPTMLEKEWHRLLTTVQGVGAKASMAILGTLGAEGVARAITLGDAKAVQSAPGVGPKLAQRVILELKSKAPSLMAMGARLASAEEAVPLVEELAQSGAGAAEPAAKPARKAAAPKPPSEAAKRAAYTADALSALANLGYSPSDAAEAVAVAAGENPEADTARLIRHALKKLAPR